MIPDDVVKPGRRPRARRRRASGAAPERSRREVAGDLDTIVLHALAPAVAALPRSSTSPTTFATPAPGPARHLARQTGSRNGTGSSHRRRRRAGVAGFTVMSVQSARLALERDRTRGRARSGSRPPGVGLLVLFVHRPGVSGAVTARELLDRGAARVDSELAGQPEIRARLLHTVGTVYQGLGLYESARAALEKALQLRRAALGDSAADVASTLDALGAVAHAKPARGLRQLDPRAVAICAGRPAEPRGPRLQLVEPRDHAAGARNHGGRRDQREALDLGVPHGPEHAEVHALQPRLPSIAAACRGRSLYVAALAIQQRTQAPDRRAANMSQARRDRHVADRPMGARSIST
jgi:hypothetical protein